MTAPGCRCDTCRTCHALLAMHALVEQERAPEGSGRTCSCYLCEIAWHHLSSHTIGQLVEEANRAPTD